MHKALSGSGVTGHSMDEDEVADDPGRVRRDSARALQLFTRSGVELILASHEHGFLGVPAAGIGPRVSAGFITGGLGAPLREVRRARSRVSSTCSCSTSRGIGSR